MSVSYIAGIAAGTEISFEDAEAIDFENVIYGDYPHDDKLIFGKWLRRVDEHDADLCFSLDNEAFLTQPIAEEIYAAWRESFPDRPLPTIKKYFVYMVH